MWRHTDQYLQVPTKFDPVIEVKLQYISKLKILFACYTNETELLYLWCYFYKTCPITINCYWAVDILKLLFFLYEQEESNCSKINNSKDILITHGTTKNLLVEVINFEIYVSLKLFNISQFLHFERIWMSYCQDILA